MNIIVTKQKFISQLMSGNASSRSCEDMDEAVLNYSQMQALASGDDRIKEKIELDADVARLKMLEAEHNNEQYRLDSTISNCQKWIRNYEQSISSAKKDTEFAEQNKPPKDTFKVEIGGKVYDERKAAGEALRDAAVAFMNNQNGAIYQPIGKFCGFELAIAKSHNGFGTSTAQIAIRNEITYYADIDLSGDIGNITRLENLFNSGISKKINELEDKNLRMKNDLQAAEGSKGKPFEHADELAAKSARLEQLNLELDVGRADEVMMNEDEDAPEQDAPERDNPDNERGKPTPPKRGRH